MCGLEGADAGLLDLQSLVDDGAPGQVQAPAIQIDFHGVEFHGQWLDEAQWALAFKHGLCARQLAGDGLVARKAGQGNGFIAAPMRLELPLGVGRLKEVQVEVGRVVGALVFLQTFLPSRVVGADVAFA